MELAAVQPRVGTPAADDGCRRAANDQAVQRLNALGQHSERAIRAGAHGALRSTEPDHLPASRRTANSENQFAVGHVLKGRIGSANHGRCDSGCGTLAVPERAGTPAGLATIRAVHLAGLRLRRERYQPACLSGDVARSQRWVNVLPRLEDGQVGLVEKGLHILAGFDDYPIANGQPPSSAVGGRSEIEIASPRGEVSGGCTQSGNSWGYFVAIARGGRRNNLRINRFGVRFG